MQKFRTFALLMVRSAPFMSNNFTVAYRLAGDSRLFNVFYTTFGTATLGALATKVPSLRRGI
jgi:hypothetical protein